MDISTPESYGTQEMPGLSKHKRYGTRVLCAECGSSKKTLYKVGELYFCRDCKEKRKETTE